MLEDSDVLTFYLASTVWPNSLRQAVQAREAAALS